MKRKQHIVIIGGGPAGLRAAEVAAAGGAEVVLYDAMRSVGRKFLVAGKSGLNLTNGERIEQFFSKYSGGDLPQECWRDILMGFDNTALREWSVGLGVETFVASSGKVFPKPVAGQIKAAPLLRRWLNRLRELGVVFKTQHRWVGMGASGELMFQHDGQVVSVSYDSAIFALGGASWSRTGSDGHWVRSFQDLGIETSPLAAANCGWEAGWPESIRVEADGLPLKNIELRAGDSVRRGELVVTRYGLEGGPIYRLGTEIRAMSAPHVFIDFKPDMAVDDLVSKMGSVSRNFVREARRRWRLDPAACALLKYLPERGPWRSVRQLAEEVKCCKVPLLKSRPVEEAISSAGGVMWRELDGNLMLRKIPNVYVVGEMIDWEAPTGGYLLQACFATGTYAAKAALASH